MICNLAFRFHTATVVGVVVVVVFFTLFTVKSVGKSQAAVVTTSMENL